MKLALAGDTMLGRGVAAALTTRGPRSLVAPELVEIAAEADLFLLNLECCISERGEPAPKTFTFRAPPIAAEALAWLGVDCVTLANNHALDFGEVALLDTFEYLRGAGISWVGAGEDEKRARAPAVLDGLRVIGVTDHPAAFAAGAGRPGVAYADLAAGLPDWLRSLPAEGTILVTPHWGPNMRVEPLPYVVAAAQALLEAGASLVAGHSAHVFQGVAGRVLFDLGDFIDDYAVDRRLRNDLGLLFLVDLERGQPVRLQALPLKLEYCYTRLATGADARWIRQRFRRACAAFGTEVSEEDGRLSIRFADPRGE